MNMKRIFNFVALCLLAVGLAGCGTPAKNTSVSQSVFWENFSIGTIIDKNTQYLVSESRDLSGMESDTGESFKQKREEMMLQIEATDVPAFISALQSGIEETIIDSGATIIGRSTGGVTGTSFSISYYENDIYGMVNIWGAHGEGTTYYLLAIVTEGR